MTNISTTQLPMSKLYALWDQLGDVPTFPEGENMDCLEEPFLHFEPGTHRETVWHWFEAQNSNFLVGEIGRGIIREDAPSSEVAQASPVAAAPSASTHWAFLQGRTAGLAGNMTERGIMAFGLSCAANASTGYNTRQWLAGFDDGALEKKSALRPPSD